jgi:hypothetical protein
MCRFVSVDPLQFEYQELTPFQYSSNNPVTMIDLNGMEGVKKEDVNKEPVDLPVLQEIAGASWRKENELKELKTQQAALERKIQLSLKQIDTSEDKPNEKQENRQPQNEKPFPIPEWLKEHKEAMGDRLNIASMPKYNFESHHKGVKIG